MAEQGIKSCNEAGTVFWGKDQSALKRASQCRTEMEKKTKVPHTIDFFEGVGGTNPVKPFYYIHPDLNCRPGARYENASDETRNQNRAFSCAVALTRLTGKYFEIFPIRRLFRGTAYEVRESHPRTGNF